MPPVSMRQLLEAGVHFGHQTRRWNPKMRPFIFAERNGIHIIDLAQTVQRLDVALDFARETVARGDAVLFVGTKKQAQEPVAQEAVRANQPYVTKRWLGGMLTNFVTIRKRIGLLEQLEARQQSGEFERIPKKEAAALTEELERLQATLGGIRRMKRLPGAVFIVDPHRERIAVTEANKLEIPVVGTGDTNVDPDELDYIIPANDDAIRSIRLLCQLVADACIEGARERAARAASEPEPELDAMPAAEPEFDENASDELVAALAGGGVVSFEPDLDEDDLLPESRPDGRADGTGDASSAARASAGSPADGSSAPSAPGSAAAPATVGAASSEASAAPARGGSAAPARPASAASAPASAAPASTEESDGSGAPGEDA
jgi:small subunit ribosomal protein S2